MFTKIVFLLVHKNILLLFQLSGARVPVHVVSFNCSKADTVKFLKNLTKMTGGRYVIYIQ